MKLGILCAIAFFSMVSANCAAADCDPNKAANDRAKTARLSGKSADAQSQSLAILKLSPQDFRANYTLGLALLDQGNSGAGLAKLNFAETLLRTKYQDCGKGLGWYTIYNTLGSLALNAGHVADAEKYLLIGDKNFATLEPNSQKKLLSNLGLLYFTINDLPKAQAYYTRAQQAGRSDASAKLRAIQQIRAATVKNPG